MYQTKDIISWNSGIADKSKTFLIGCTFSTGSSILSNNISFSYATFGGGARLDQFSQIHFQILVGSGTPDVSFQLVAHLFVLKLDALMV